MAIEQLGVSKTTTASVAANSKRDEAKFEAERQEKKEAASNDDAAVVEIRSNSSEGKGPAPKERVSSGEA